MGAPVTTLVTYKPKKGKAAELEALVRQHAPVLRATGLITEEPVRVWSATDKRSGEEYFVEQFQWLDEEASAIAHQTPEIMAVWEPMNAVLEELTLAKLEPLD